MDEQYWDALTNRIQSAESFLRESCVSHSPSLIEKEMEAETEVASPIGEEYHRGSGDTGTIRRLPKGTNEAILSQLIRTIEDGRIAFKNLIDLSNKTFFVGGFLVCIAAISGLLLQNVTITVVFGGLGVTVLVAIFALKPMDQIQIALVNMIQAQTVFLDFYNQLQFWAPYAQESVNTEKKQQASQSLHDATTFALKALHAYIIPSALGEQKGENLYRTGTQNYRIIDQNP